MPDFHKRRDRLRKLICQAQADAMLVTGPKNVTYLTGFTGEDSYLLLHDRAVMLSDPRYTAQIEEECPGLEMLVRRPGKPILELAVGAIRSARIQRLAIEGGSMTAESLRHLEKALPRVELIVTSGMVEQLREVKDREEVEKIRQSARIAERAFAVVKASLRGGMSEKEVADELEYQVRLFGGQCGSFPPVVAAGERAALPHARPGGARIGDSRFLLVDWGAQFDLYASDLTRMILLGKASPRLQRVYETVLAAQQRAIEAIRPGTLMEEVDAAARDVVTAAGYGRRWRHSVGHGIGLDVHELPRLAVDQKRPLLPGMVVTVEPGIYIPGWGGVRIEDDVLVTRDGHEVITQCPKELADCTIADSGGSN